MRSPATCGSLWRSGSATPSTTAPAARPLRRSAFAGAEQAPAPARATSGSSGDFGLRGLLAKRRRTSLRSGYAACCLLGRVAGGLDRRERSSLAAGGELRPGGLCRLCARSVHPDPVREGRQESEADLDASPDEVDQWRSLLQLLATDTVDPDDCYFGLCEGWGFPGSARRWPTFGIPRGAGLPARAYFLFHGSLSEAAIRGTRTDHRTADPRSTSRRSRG